jgi:hypothetical protein
MEDCDVTLLTFAHNLFVNVSNANIMATRLADVFGAERVQHQIINIHHLFKSVILKPLVGDLVRHQSYPVCLGCKLCMHTQTIVYAQNNGIKQVADGNVRDATFDQTEPIAGLFREFYRDHGLEYLPFSVGYAGLSNVLWEHDERKEQKALLSENGLLKKDEMSTFSKYRLQPFCLNGQVNMVLNERFIPVSLDKMIAYGHAKLPLLTEHIRRHTHGRNLSASNTSTA